MSLFYCLSLFSVVLLVTCLTVKGGDAGGEENDKSQTTLGSADNPASSCREIMDALAPNKPSGYYHVKNSIGKTVRVYCDMTVTCADDYGWFRIAKFDMSNTSHNCPEGLELKTDYNTRRCVKPGDEAGCSSTKYSSLGIYYRKLCGRILGYQYSTTDSFGYSQRTIDEAYLDGVSLTYGYMSRHHIWSFASAVIDGGLNGAFNNYYICPCTNPDPQNTGFIPDFVGDDYFCDSGTDVGQNFYAFQAQDPLWDGAGCSGPSTCCSLNNPPYFEKNINTFSNSDVEMRVCRDQSHHDEDVAIKSVEIYIL